MVRRFAILGAALGILAAVVAVGQQKPAARPLVLDWAGKAKLEKPAVAVLIEMGRRDAQPKNWSGKASVSGAKVVHREGYRFWPDDKLTGTDGWQASSHRPLRAPKNNPAIAAIEGIATVGVVLHLADVQPNAALTLSVQEQEIDGLKVPLADLLAGKPLAPLADGRLTVRLISTTVPVYTAPTEDNFPAAAYGPDGTLWLAWIAYHVADESRRIEAPQLKAQPKDFSAFATPEYRDQLLVKYLRNGKWSNPFAVTGPREDLIGCAIAVEKDGIASVSYSAKRQDLYEVFVRTLDLNTPEAVSHPAPKMGPEVKLRPAEANAGSSLAPVMCVDQVGSACILFQTWQQERSAAGGLATQTIARRQKGEWKLERLPATGNAWPAAIVAGDQDRLAVAGDVYNKGDYDTLVHVMHNRGLVRVTETYGAGTPRFEARPSVCYDAQGRLWIAYEEGPELWGKDYGALEKKPGNPLYASRSVRVVCVQDGKQFTPAAVLPTADEPPPKFPYEVVKIDAVTIASGTKFEKQPRYSNPQIGLDGKGRLWLTYRAKFGTRYSTHPGSYWLTYARRLDGDRWTEPIELHHSDGLLDHKPVLLPHPAGGLLVIHNTDGRYTTPEHLDNQLYMSCVDLPGDPVEPKLAPAAFAPLKKETEAARQEAADVARMRAYRVDVGGKKYQPLRGEFHRHTELSWDGGPDGSLSDMWRYGIDAAAFDWIGNGDHDNGAGREYSWWLVQKYTDAYHVKDCFTPMFTYERSVSYPHGHRNVVFAQRGMRTLPRLAEPDAKLRVAGIHADDTKMLYRYLKEHGGVCASHTSATGMGTDWRDHDPAVEPFVEIYQGDRMSYEMQNAPRAGFDPKTGKEPANIAGWYPLGFIDQALAKGHRLGFQASSDHWSTHISYCIVLAERPDRAAILDAMRKRHVYGATDNIILDVRSGAHIMGDEFKTAAAPTLQIKVIGTNPLAKVEVLKDCQVVQTYEPGKAEFAATWTDPQPTAGTHYYYVRVQQSGGELAWGSPMWIDWAK